jgi:hypothetical protein
MQLDIIRKIEEELKTIATQYYRIIIVCETFNGNSVEATAKKLDKPLLNLNLLLSKELREIPKSKRANKIQSILRKILSRAESNTIFLNHIEILFDTDLGQDALNLLQSLSRNYTLIVSWKGLCNENRIIYGESSHPEYYVCQEFTGRVI